MTSDPTLVLLAPPGVHDPDPAQTAARGVRITAAVDTTTIGIVGVSRDGIDALDEAARNPHVVRLVLVNVPFEPDVLRAEPASVAAKILLLFGARDVATGSAHGRRWQRLLPDARLEMVPDGGEEILDRMWTRVLAHLAPRRPGTR